jgi:hypothetical protein
LHKKLKDTKDITTLRDFFSIVLNETGVPTQEQEAFYESLEEIHPEERRGNRRKRRRPQPVLPLKRAIDVEPILIAEAVAEAASVLALYCISEGILTDDTIQIGAMQVGVLWLASAMIGRDMWSSVRNETPHVIEYPDVIAELLQALRPCKMVRRTGRYNQIVQTINYAGQTTDTYVGGSSPLFPSGFPLVPGRLSKASISWPTTSGPQNPLNTTVPLITDEQLLEYGPLAIQQVLEEIGPIGGFELILTTTVLKTKKSHAVFSNVRSAYYPNANPEDGIWGESASEILVPNEFAWLSFLAMFEYDPSRVTPFISTNFIGMHGFFDRFQVGADYRGSERVHFQATEIPASQLLNADAGIALGADIDKTTENQSPISNDGTTITQRDDSALYNCGGTDMMYYLLGAYSRYLKENWVLAFSFQSDTQVLCGATFAPNNALTSVQIPFETAARLASLQPDDSTNRGNSCYSNYVALTAKGKLMLNPDDGRQGGQSPQNTLDSVATCLYPALTTINYEWGVERGSYSVDFIDPFDYSVCYTKGTNIDDVAIAVNDVWNTLQAQVNLGDANGLHESDRKLVYYRQFLAYDGISSLVNPQGFDLSVYQTVDFMGSDLEILPEEVGADTMGILPIVYIDISMVTREELQYYRTIYRVFCELVYTTLYEETTLIYLICIYLRGTYHTKWAAEQQEYSEALISMVGRSAGGGRGFFKRVYEAGKTFLPKLIKQVAPAATKLISRVAGPEAGEVVAKIAELIGSSHNSDISHVQRLALDYMRLRKEAEMTRRRDLRK